MTIVRSLNAQSSRPRPATQPALQCIRSRPQLKPFHRQLAFGFPRDLSRHSTSQRPAIGHATGRRWLGSRRRFLPFLRTPQGLTSSRPRTPRTPASTSSSRRAPESSAARRPAPTPAPTSSSRGPPVPPASRSPARAPARTSSARGPPASPAKALVSRGGPRVGCRSGQRSVPCN